MLEMRAIVVQIEDGEASVRPLNSGGCGHCTREGGCGSSALSNLFCSSQPRHFRARNGIQAKVGDEVQVSLPDGALLHGAARMYLLPLALLLGGGIAGALLVDEGVTRDAWAALGAALGLLLGFVLARQLPSRNGQAFVSSIVVHRSVS